MARSKEFLEFAFLYNEHFFDTAQLKDSFEKRDVSIEQCFFSWLFSKYILINLLKTIVLYIDWKNKQNYATPIIMLLVVSIVEMTIA